MNCTTGYDTMQYMEPLGVFAGIAPWNFPAMIPMGWMAPLCIATGNTHGAQGRELRARRRSLRIAELWQEAGLPKGVLNVVTCSRNEAEILLQPPRRQGHLLRRLDVGRPAHLSTTAAANGKRVQALTEAKNHALVLRGRRAGAHGAAASSTPPAAAPASAAWRCRWSWPRRRSPTSWWPRSRRLMQRAEDRPGLRQDQPARPAGQRRAPRVRHRLDREGHRGRREAGARRPQASRCPGYENGFYLGPTLFDHVSRA